MVYGSGAATREGSGLRGQQRRSLVANGNAVEEEVVWEGGPSQVINFGTYLLCFLFFWLIIPIFIALWRYVVTSNMRYTLTTQRLGYRHGVLSKEADVLELYRVKDMRVLEPFFLRMFGMGNIIMDTSDRSHPTFILQAVPEPARLRDIIRNHVERRRDEKGVREVDFEGGM
jgi:uncharacterized membrane protein YdbT with pleckstrin-like domain